MFCFMLRCTSAVVLSALLLVPVTAGVSPTQVEGGFVPPAEFNIRVESDVRTLVVMAAVNIAGFDYEPGGAELSPARVELRRDLAGLNPTLRAKLADFYRSRRRPDVDETVDAARYAALSLMMNQPPSFTIYFADDEMVPADLRPLLGFVPLVQEFYINSGIRELLPKYQAVADGFLKSYMRPVGETAFITFDYFKIRPETIISIRPLVIGGDEPGRARDRSQTVITRFRTRYVFLVLDPFGARDSAHLRADILNQKEDLVFRRAGDDYVIIVGPSSAPIVQAIRPALIRFTIDPMIERHLRKTLEFKDEIVRLLATVPTAKEEYRNSVYLVVRESLAHAADTRMRRIQSTRISGAYGEDEAVFDLAQAYLEGAVLAFHFYESLIGLERVGTSIESFFDQMVATTRFEREAKRPLDFEATVASVTEARRERARAVSASADPASLTLAEKIVLSDDFIRSRKFAEARAVLEEILRTDPDNARAIYGLARVANQYPDPVELDPESDENDKIQAQYDRLNRAVALYRRTIQKARPGPESWLIQWSHVLTGRIFDFMDFRNDALAEYEKAIALGDVPNGALREAHEGQKQPFGSR